MKALCMNRNRPTAQLLGLLCLLSLFGCGPGTGAARSGRPRWR